MRLARVVPALGALTLTALLTGTLSGCSAPQPTDDALAVVDGAHANAPVPQLSGDLSSAIDQIVRAQATAAVIVNSGQPTVLTQGRLTRTCNNSTSCDQAIARSESLVAAAINNAKAQQPENNLLAALNLAALTVHDHAGIKTVAVIDSGLQTTGSLRFQDPGVLTAEPSDIADFLARTHALPDLTGTTVVLTGLGDTWAPQQPLSTAQRANLKAIWEAIARRAGAVDVQVIDTPLAATQPAPELPSVTPVALDPPNTFNKNGGDIELPDTTISFQPDTAVLKDPAAARSALADLANYLTAKRTPILLTGTTANVGPLDSQKALSEQRADAIKTVLVDLGVPSSLMTTNGVGSQWPGYTLDHDSSGVLLPGPAELNRKVIVNPRGGASS